MRMVLEAAVWLLVSGFLLVLFVRLFPVLIVDHLLPRKTPLSYKGTAEAPLFAVVTGATSGLGRAISTFLAKNGVSLILVALDDHFLAHHAAFLMKIKVITPPLLRF
jgi:hypothetical protein